MKINLPDEIVSLFGAPDTVKVLSTTDNRGVPHSVVKNSLRADDDGNLAYLEMIESSDTNSNMTGSLWFDRQVSILLIGANGASWQIKGSPERCLVAGPVFEAHYREIREKQGDVDLAAVWVITPEEVRDESFDARFAEESAAHPMFLHLDRIAKTD
ncbi:MAG: hypothetical protein LBK91_00850 [Synergistaceae bacterium]|jgi:hypothetical protein|nr:hypothetical protein [Synergistaceae bacterium]